MIDLKILEKHGITQESLKAKLAGDPMQGPGGKAPERGLSYSNENDPTEKEKIQGFLNRMRSRIQEGMTRNLSDYKHYYALDKAWDAPFRQLTPTLLSDFVNSDPNQDKVFAVFQQWGLTHLITETPDPKNAGKVLRQLNVPLFFEVFVPLVKSYVTIRWAKIMNDRRLTPFFKYEPEKLNAELQLKCDVITDRVQIMSNQMGYFDVMKQAVLKMLHYAFCLQFPKEEWYTEEQIRYADEQDVQNGKLGKDGKLVTVGEEIRVIDKEGIRYHNPHPTRTYWDIAHGAYTFNYDNGCQYSGYWRIARYSEIEGNAAFWNRDRISLGSVDYVGQNPLFFQSVYSACQLKIGCFTPQPATQSGAAAAAGVGAGPGPNDREKEIGMMYYGSNYGDQGVMVTEHFEKIIPKDCGLGDYDCPVWFRFIVAGDGCTVLYAAPLPYAPTIYYGYDADESRSKNSSMSLEILPYQDHFGNTLSQIILTAKQNLANLVLLDEDQINVDSKKAVEGMGERFFRKLNIAWFSSKKAFKGQNKVAEASQSFSYPKGNVSELTGVLKTILDVLERVLVMSSQEVAQAASHEQTREEIKNISSSTSSRLVFTATPVDIARDAWKRQLYQGLMAYGDDDFYVSIPSDIPLAKPILLLMGFTFVDKDVKEGKDMPASGNRVVHYRAKISKNRTAIPLYELASNRDNEDRTNNEKIAATLATILNNALANPMLAQAIGPDQALMFVNALCQFAGLPRDMKFKNASPDTTPEQQQQQAQEQLKAVVQTVLQQVNQGLSKELEPLMEATRSNSKDLTTIMPFIAQIAAALHINPTPPPNDSPEPVAPSGSASPVAP